MAVSGMNHFTILTDDVPRSVEFYGRLLGLRDGPRPDLGFPGAWMYVGDEAILHIVGGQGREQLRAGVIDHMAFTAHDLADTIATLTAYNIEHTCRQQVGTGLWQVFFYDPNGARVELDFSPGEVRK